MTGFMWSTDWRTFFGERPYPFDLELVEQRDLGDGRVAFLDRLFGSHAFGTVRRVLDLGCGYGRHMVALTQCGYDAFGVDVSARAVTRANWRLQSRTAVVATTEHLPFATACFDAAVSLYTSIGWSGTDSRLILAEAARVVRPGGLLVIDVANGATARRQVGWERVRGGLAVWIRWPDTDSIRQRNLVVSTRNFGLYGFDHHRYNREGLLHEIWATEGWQIAAEHGDFDGGPVSPQSHRLVVVACRTA
jgi:SAM-dependent methyltransferase